MIAKTRLIKTIKVKLKLPIVKALIDAPCVQFLQVILQTQSLQPSKYNNLQTSKYFW